MAYCWAASVRERPTAFQLYRELHKFHRQLYEYIWALADSPALLPQPTQPTNFLSKNINSFTLCNFVNNKKN